MSLLFTDNEARKIRKKNVEILSDEGYIVSPHLPLSNQRVEALRPFEEISCRLFSLMAILFWVIQDDSTTSSKRILSQIERNNLTSVMTDDEIHILNLERREANRLYAQTIGWRFENMWALAWVLGFSITPVVDMGQISDNIIQPLIYEFLPSFDSNIDYMDKYTKKTNLQVFELEDLFYCAHNAVRSAQVGGKTIPDNRDVIIQSGTIHEKRHSLTWCLSPNTLWDDVDLST